MFKEISIQDIKLNPITDFRNDWMALTAGNKKNGYNAMTVAWGQFGSLWERGSHSNRLPTAICYIRPGRYTKEFMDKEDFFTLPHFGSAHKKALAYLGTHSGRDGDKIITPVFADGVTYFEEAETVYICHKLYHAGFTDNGTEWTTQLLVKNPESKTMFEKALEDMDIIYHRIRVATLRHNGKVERQHRLD